jgi:ethanolamine ammonia-lyase large subunit
MIERFDFSDLRELFAKANEEKSGDQLAGIAARSERERVAAKRTLADLTLEQIVRRPLIDPSEDDITRLILDTFDQEAFRPIGSMTVGEFREFLLDDETTDAQLQPLQRAVIPEIAAAVTKLMSNKDLVLAAAKIRNVTRCRNTMGERGVLGIRLQPQSPCRRHRRYSSDGIRRPALWLRRCSDRRESGDGLGGNRQLDSSGFKSPG